MSSRAERTDGELVLATLAGERDQFDVLVGRYYTPLWRLAANRTGCEQLAQDIVQETFLCAYRSLHTYDSRYQFRTWLWTILLNQCRRQAKRRDAQTGRWTDWGAGAVRETAAVSERGADPSERLVSQERRQRLQAVLDQLPEAQADAVRLRFFGELKFQEIADAMQCSLSTAKNRVRWGLARMAELMESEDVSDSAVTAAELNHENDNHVR